MTLFISEVISGWY